MTAPRRVVDGADCPGEPGGADPWQEIPRDRQRPARPTRRPSHEHHWDRYTAEECQQPSAGYDYLHCPDCGKQVTVAHDLNAWLE